MAAIISITFGEHINTERISSMLSALQATGNVSEGYNARTYTVEVRRASHMAYLQEQLTKWELYGFLKYKIE